MKHKYYLSEVTYLDTINYVIFFHSETKELICAWNPHFCFDREKHETYFEEWGQGHYFGHDENSMLLAKDFIKTKLFEHISSVKYELDSTMRDFDTLMEEL